MTVCEEHHVQLQDRCPKCGAAINFHRNELGDHRKLVGLSLTLCHVCGLDLRTADELVTCKDRQALIAKLDEVNFEKGLLRALNSGFVKLSEDLTIYSMLYFTGLRHLMKILAMCNKRIETLRHAIAESYGVAVYTPPPSHPDVQELNTTARRQLLGLARCLLEEWPHRFIELSQRCKVWSALWLRHLEPYSKGRVAPFWFWSVVHAHLYRARYCPSNEEVKAATAHLKNRGRILTDSSLSRLLGVSVLPRRKAL